MFKAIEEDFSAAFTNILLAGGLPTDDSAPSRFARCFKLLLDYYFDGRTALGAELVGLIDAMTNPDDATVAKLGEMERFTLFGMLNQFKQGRKQIERQNQKEAGSQG